MDLYIVNTCSVTSVADKKSRQMLHLAKKYNDKVIVIAVGCLVDSLNIKNDKIVDDSDKKESIPGVDYIVSNEEKNNLSNIVSAIFKDKLHIKDEKNSFSNDRIRSFIKIQDGCNQFCSYCLIPYLRGNISSRNDEDIIDEIEVKSKNGVKEIVLTGIHISSFDSRILRPDKSPQHGRWRPPHGAGKRRFSQYRLCLPTCIAACWATPSW